VSKPPVISSENTSKAPPLPLGKDWNDIFPDDSYRKKRREESDV
jgi:hypothetical protein